MKIVRNSIIPFGKKYAALNLFGVLFVKRGVRVCPELLNHELIHTAQMQELLFVPFYILYLAEWIVRMVQCRGNSFEAYLRISFEREAYDNGHDLSYLSHRRHFSFMKWL